MSFLSEFFLSKEDFDRELLKEHPHAVFDDSRLSELSERSIEKNIEKQTAKAKLRLKNTDAVESIINSVFDSKRELPTEILFWSGGVIIRRRLAKRDCCSDMKNTILEFANGITYDIAAAICQLIRERYAGTYFFPKQPAKELALRLNTGTWYCILMLNDH